MRTLADLEREVLDEQDRILFQEAEKSATCGALRGAYILVWLSCAESLKRRFSGVSVRDATAKRVAGEIKRMEEARKAIDLYVLSQAREYGFIDDPGHSRLKHVYEMRCVYGHPYERQPTPEELISAAAATVDLVLSKPLLLRHGYLQEQIRLLSMEAAFLDDHKGAVSEYAKEVAARVDPNLSLWFIEKLWTAGEAVIADKSQARFVQRIVWFSVAFLNTVGFDVKGNDLRPTFTKTPLMGSVTLSSALLFPHLPTHAQDIVVGNLLGWKSAQGVAAKMLQELLDAGVLNPRQIERFDAAIQTIPPHVLASAGVPPGHFCNRIVDQLRSYNWYKQEEAIGVLNVLGPAGIASLGVAQQRVMGNNVLQAADGKCNAARSLLTRISTDNAIWPGDFVEGVIAECVVNDANQYRFKNKCAVNAMLCIRSVAQDSRADLVDRIVSRLHSSTPKHGVLDGQERDDMLTAIDTAIATDAVAFHCLQPLRQVLAGLEVPQDDT